MEDSKKGLRFFFSLVALVALIGGFTGVIIESVRTSENHQIDKEKDISTNLSRQMDDLGKPTVTPFLPDENFTVVESSEEGIAIANLFLTTIVVKRTKDDAIFRSAAKIYYDDVAKTLIPGMEVKIFKIFWKQTIAVNAGFLLALPLDEAAHLGDAAHFPQPLAKNPK